MARSNRCRLLPALLLAPCLAMPAVAIAGTATTATSTAGVARAGPAAAEGAGEAASPDAPVPVPEPGEKALSYYRTGNVLWLANVVWGIVLPSAFLFTGFSARLRTWARSVGKNWYFTLAVYFLLFSVIVFVVELPLSVYQEYLRPHAYGLSNQTLSKWAGDALKGLAVSVVAGWLVLWIPYLLLRKSPRRWWLYTGLLSVPVLLFTMMVVPVFVDPLFNDFGPMKDRALERRILDLAERAGIDGGRVFEVDKSVDTKAVSAYVTGFMGTQRIVLWDTIIAKMDDDELLFVVGHEAGHYVLGHVSRSILVISAVVLLSLYAAYRFSGGIIRRYRSRLGFDDLADVASLPLILLLMQLSMLVVMPVLLAYTRHLEHEADRFGLEITHDNRAAATAFVKLQQENLGNPRPGLMYKLWRSTHPTLGDRIDFCNGYRPWERGEPSRYAHLFRDPPKRNSAP